MRGVWSTHVEMYFVCARSLRRGLGNTCYDG